MLYIRADGNAEIGTGHVMRCLSIARAARSQGTQCVFIVADKNMAVLLDEQGFRYICLDSVWNDLNRETAQMERLIQKENIRLLLIDSYFVAPEYLSRLHQRLRQDMFAKRVPVICNQAAASRVSTIDS